MTLSDFFAHVRRYDANAAVIFDHNEPVGHATDLVMPRRRFFKRRATQNTAASRSQMAPPNDR